MSMMEQQIKEFLKIAEDWGKMPTKQVAGISIVKMPATKTRPALLALEINPMKDGKPMKRKGLFVTSAEMLVSFSEILTTDAVLNLMKSVESINASVLPKNAPKPLDLDS